MILFIENLKHTTRKLLELINEYGKVAGYKINTQKSPAFLYTSNEKTEREIKEQSYIRRGGKNTQKTCTKKIFTTNIITMV